MKLCTGLATTLTELQLQLTHTQSIEKPNKLPLRLFNNLAKFYKNKGFFVCLKTEGQYVVGSVTIFSA